jgi:hypothetical protein
MLVGRSGTPRGDYVPVLLLDAPSHGPLTVPLDSLEKQTTRYPKSLKPSLLSGVKTTKTPTT